MVALKSSTAAAAAVLLLVPAYGHAAWPTDPAVNVPIRTGAQGSYFPSIVSDGHDGAIIVGNGTTAVWAQRVDQSGVTQWTSNGISVSDKPSYEYYVAPTMDDGAGGAIIAWMAYLGTTLYDIYVQRINGAGLRQWTSTDVPVAIGNGDHDHPVIASDGAGGVIIAWRDSRTSKYDLFAQRFDAAGVRQWSLNGIPVSQSPGDHDAPQIVADGAGGAIIAWMDHRGAAYDIYAQRINSSGTRLWSISDPLYPLDGVPVCTAANDQRAPALVSDGASGAILSWMDLRGADYDIYAQRLRFDGVVLWTPQGVALNATSGHQGFQASLPDGSGGAVVTWMDTPSSAGAVYAQRVSSSGATLWTSNGVVLSASGGHDPPVIASDGGSGVIIGWPFQNATTSLDIYAQRLNSSGTPQWTALGAGVCTATGADQFAGHFQEYGQPNAVLADPGRGAIFVWEDNRASPTGVYAQRIGPNGALGGTVVGVGESSPAVAFEVVPNPAVGGVTFRAPPLATDAAVEVLDLAGRRLWSSATAAGASRWNGALRSGGHAPPGVYLARCSAGGQVTTLRFVWLR